MRRERELAIESSRRGWQALRDTEAARDRAQEEAAWIVLRVSELEAAFSHQATIHGEAVQALTLERDTSASACPQVIGPNSRCFRKKGSHP